MTTVDEVRVKLRARDYAGAVELCQSALSEGEPQAPLYRILGFGFAGLRDHQAAVDAMSKAIELDPGNPDLYFNRGRWAIALDELEQADSDFTVVLDELRADYYHDTCRLLRAHVRWLAGKGTASRADCELVQDPDARARAPGVTLSRDLILSRLDEVD